MKTSRLINLFLALFALGATLVGCKDAGCTINEGIGGNEISFSSNISLSPMRAYDNTWQQGDLISVYMLKSSVLLNASTATSDVYYDGVQYKAKEQGLKVGFEANTEADRMYFPSAQDVDFVAFYPASLVPASDRTIALDMASNPVDLLYSNNAKGKNRTTLASDLLLTFKHALSAIRVSLEDANGNAIENATMKLSGFNTQATFSLADGTLSNIQGSADINLQLKNQKFDAILLPQTISADQAKLVVTYQGKNYEYVIPAISYTQGRRVSYKLKLVGDKIEAIISGEITDWEEVDGGNATLTPSQPSSEVSTFTVSANSLSFDATGGEQTLTVTTDASSFTATSSEAWLTATANVAAGTVKVVAAANPNATERTATLTLQHNNILRAAPQTLTVTVTQAAAQAPQPQAWDGGIAKLRKAFEQGATSVAQETTIEAIVINSISQNNNSLKNLIVSDGKAGIAIRLVDNVGKDSGIDAGTELEITLPAGTKLERYKGGALQINNLANSNLKVVSSSHTLEPIEVSLADLMTVRIKGDLESRLVKVSGVQFETPNVPFANSASNTYHKIVENSSTQPAAGFSLPSLFASKFNKWNLTLPNGNGTIVGATSFSTFGGQTCNIFIRSTSDLQLKGARK